MRARVHAHLSVGGCAYGRCCVYVCVALSVCTRVYVSVRVRFSVCMDRLADRWLCLCVGVHRFVAATNVLEGALAAATAAGDAEVQEAVLCNLGHACRRAGQLGRARACLQQATTLAPTAPGPHAALAFLDQMEGDLAAAVDGWHTVLGLRPDLPLADELLVRALAEASVARVQAGAPPLARALPTSVRGRLRQDDALASAAAPAAAAATATPGRRARPLPLPPSPMVGLAATTTPRRPGAAAAPPPARPAPSTPGTLADTSMDMSMEQSPG
jgi:hypothetical protein